MLMIEHVKNYGWEPAVRGMRNPLNSWEKSDSGWEYDHFVEPIFVVGPNDLALMQKLVRNGSDHSKFMRQIIVSMDITAPLYWWKEYDTYKIGTVANSCSTMHKIHSKKFELDDFSHERMDSRAVAYLLDFIEFLETERQKYNATRDRQHWHNIIQALPSSYNQLRTVTLNYAVLRNIYHARKDHKLAEWHDLCAEIMRLPYAKELICDG